MSLAIKYEAVDDARMRLRNTVVMYRNEPVLVQEIARGEDKDEILRVLFNPLPVRQGAVKKKADAFGRRLVGDDAMDALEEKAQQRKYISSKHFDIAPFKMGYVNHPTLGAFYTQRLPNRVQKQGLCAENFSGFTNNPLKPVDFNTFITCKESVEMIAGIYPSFDRALKLLEKAPAVAFSREFALSKDEVIPDLIFLYHKAKKVGYFAKDEAVLGANFKCLKESLEECKIKVGVR